MTKIRGAGTVEAVLDGAVIDEFRGSLQGALLGRAEAGYGDACRVWNA